MLYEFDVFRMSDLSTLFEVLAADTRRRVVYMLCDTDTLRVPEGLQIRGQATTRRSGGGQTMQNAPSDDQSPNAFEMELYHTHLPKLESEGIVEWDRRSQTVARGPTFEEIEPALRMLAMNATSLPGELF